MNNLTETERQGIKHFKTDLLPWDASLSVVELGTESSLLGKSLRELSFKENWGVTIAAVIRGERRLFAPAGDFVLWPHDRLVCFGSEEELLDLHRKLEKDQKEHRWSDNSVPKYRLSSFEVDEFDIYHGKSIRDSRLREERKILVVGVERGNDRILGPSSAFVLNAGDLIWVISE